MPRIALVDDRKSIRESLATNFTLALPQAWELIASAPLPDPSGYVDWIVKHDVQVIVIDWVLDEQGGDVEHTVAYKGGRVVETVRKQLPFLPVFVITAQPGDADLEDHIGDVEEVITRQQFSGEPKRYVKRMLRAGGRFAKHFQEDLVELAKLAEKTAAGTANDGEKARLVALQTTLGLVPDVGTHMSRANAMDAFEKKLGEVESLGNEIRGYLKGNRK